MMVFFLCKTQFTYEYIRSWINIILFDFELTIGTTFTAWKLYGLHFLSAWSSANYRLAFHWSQRSPSRFNLFIGFKEKWAPPSCHYIFRALSLSFTRNVAHFHVGFIKMRTRRPISMPLILIIKLKYTPRPAASRKPQARSFIWLHAHFSFSAMSRVLLNISGDNALFSKLSSRIDGRLISFRHHISG